MNKNKVLDAVIIFIVAVAILLFVSPIAAAKMGFTGIAIPEILLVLIAVGAVLIRKDSVSERLSLAFPTIKSIFGSFLLVLGANAWQNAVTVLQTAITGTTSQTDLTFFDVYSDKVTPFAMLMVVALVPAICEEIFFRGFLLNCFKTKKSMIPAIIISAVLFAGIHLDLYKFLPLLIMGLSYGYIAAKTKSVLIPAIFHFLNNSLAIIAYYSEKNAPETEEVITSALLSGKNALGYAITSVGFGLLLVYFGIRFLSGRKPEKRTKLFALISSGAIFTLGMAILVMNMMYIPYEKNYSNQITEDTEFSENFTITTEAYAFIDVSLKSNRELNCNVVITDSLGSIVYDHQNSNSSVLELQPDEYTVTYSFNVNENFGIVYNVSASVKISCISLSETALTSNSEETADSESYESGTPETSEMEFLPL